MIPKFFLPSLWLCVFSLGCAGMIVGSKGWFAKQKPNVATMAMEDLKCPAEQIRYTPTSADYREVTAKGCGASHDYQFVKIGFSESWSR